MYCFVIIILNQSKMDSLEDDYREYQEHKKLGLVKEKTFDDPEVTGNSFPPLTEDEDERDHRQVNYNDLPKVIEYENPNVIQNTTPILNPVLNQDVHHNYNKNYNHSNHDYNYNEKYDNKYKNKYLYKTQHVEPVRELTDVEKYFKYSRDCPAELIYMLFENPYLDYYNLLDSGKQSVLTWLCVQKHEREANIIIDKIDIKLLTTPNEHNCVPLTFACKNGMHSTAEKLFRLAPEAIEIISTAGHSCLMLAIKSRMPSLAIKMIDSGKSKPEYISNDGFSAMDYAVDNYMHDVQYKLKEALKKLPRDTKNPVDLKKSDNLKKPVDLEQHNHQNSDTLQHLNNVQPRPILTEDEITKFSKVDDYSDTELEDMEYLQKFKDRVTIDNYSPKENTRPSPDYHFNNNNLRNNNNLPNNNRFLNNNLLNNNLYEEEEEDIFTNDVSSDDSDDDSDEDYDYYQKPIRATNYNIRRHIIQNNKPKPKQ